MSVFDDMTDLLQSGVMGAFEEAAGVLFRPGGAGSGVTVRAIFDAEALVAEAGGEFGVSTYKPMFSFERADFDALGLERPTQGDRVTLASGAVYEVVEPQHDGRSEYRAIMRRVA